MTKRGQTNLQKLHAAGLVAEPKRLSKQDVKIINGLSAEEIEALTRIKGKLGDDFLKRNLDPTPNCIL